MEWVRHTKERKAISHHVLYGDKTRHGNTNEEHGDLTRGTVTCRGYLTRKQVIFRRGKSPFCTNGGLSYREMPLFTVRKIPKGVRKPAKLVYI